MNSYDPGDPVRLVGTFTNVAGALTSPTTVTLRIYPPAQFGGVTPGTVEYTLAQGSVVQQVAGSYTYDLNPLPSGTPGVWRYVYVGSGAINAQFQGAFAVRQEPW